MPEDGVCRYRVKTQVMINLTSALSIVAGLSTRLVLSFSLLTHLISFSYQLSISLVRCKAGFIGKKLQMS